MSALADGLRDDQLRHDRGNAAGSPSHSSIAFIVHSANTLVNGLPPDVDNKPLARQKRRRTSPEDQSILESEYLRNPKPDKAARMDIVSRVALGEKEVQIWFQNRRQASRRKSRPLEPHEIAAYQISRSSDASSKLTSSFSASQGSVSTPEGRDLLRFQSSPHEMSGSPVVDSRSIHANSSSASRGRGHLADLTASSLITRSQDSIGSSQASHRPTVDYIVNGRRDVANSQGSNTDDTPPTSQETHLETKGVRRDLRRTSSNVRLSLTTDGAAKIITKNDSSPSPPRKQPSPPTTSIDSPAADSDHSFGTLDPAEAARLASLTRKPSNRARDSRAWEFWADKDSRSELVEKADQEASGSAADAIGLLRSASGRSILGQLTGKRSAMHGDNDAAKRSKRGPLLQRSQSMHNRPVGGWRGTGPRKSGSPRKFKKAQSGLGIQILATDSDKENWSPDRSVSQIDDADSVASDAEGGKASGRHRARSTVTPGKLLVGMDHSAASVGQSSDPEDDPEVASFMEGGRHQRKSNSVSEEEELDCVQGLLSLSQGNWR